MSLIIISMLTKADFARWIDCVALDGGVRPAEDTDNPSVQETQVILVHRKASVRMENFTPGNYAVELHGKAFKDHLGEFIINAYPIEEIAGGEDYLTEVLKLVANEKEVKRIMVIPDAENAYIYNKVREALRKVDDDEKRITLFAMQPMTGGNYRQEILGYSLMAALGIRSEELNRKS